MSRATEKVQRRMLRLGAWNHKLRMILSASILSFIGAVLGIYGEYSYDISIVSKTSIVVLSTMITAFVGLLLLALID